MARARSLGANADPAPDQQGSEPGWPMPVDQFINEEHLRHSDILLTRREWNPMSWLIRYSTSSNFAHASQVFLTPKWQFGWQSTYLIESVFSGVEITDLKDYFKHPRMSVAVKRLNRPWFDNQLRRRVRGRMLDDIKADYAFSTMFGLGRQLLFGLQGAISGHKAAVRQREKASHRRRNEASTAAKEFICSGFIQLGYAQGVLEFVREGAVPAEAIADVMFDKNLAQLLRHDWGQFTTAESSEIIAEFMDEFYQELLAVTPLDMELSDNFDWEFTISNGLVYPTRTYTEVCNVLGIDPIVR
jgi:hypothetical protein